MKIGIDTLGFENDPIIAFEAAKKFIREHKDLEIILIGNKYLIDRAKKENILNISFVHTENFVRQEDNINIIRTKKDFSIQLGCDLLKEGKIDALISSCNTAIFVATTFIKIGTLPNIDKFAFLTTIPTLIKDRFFYLLDSGANKNVTGNNLYQFALMANIYVTNTTNLSSPRIGVVNVGTEENKGFEEHKIANELIKNDKNLNYVGFVETRNLINNKDADIFVTNGYTGNIILKTLEGSMKSVGAFFKEEYKKIYNTIPYLLNRHIIKKMINRFDYKNHAGAFLLGLNKPVMKGHGSSDEKQMYSCIKMMYDALKANVFSTINKEIKKINNNE